MLKPLTTTLTRFAATPMKLSTFGLTLLVILSLAALARCTALAH